MLVLVESPRPKTEKRLARPADHSRPPVVHHYRHRSRHCHRHLVAPRLWAARSTVPLRRQAQLLLIPASPHLERLVSKLASKLAMPQRKLATLARTLATLATTLATWARKLHTLAHKLATWASKLGTLAHKLAMWASKLATWASKLGTWVHKVSTPRMRETQARTPGRHEGQLRGYVASLGALQRLRSCRTLCERTAQANHNQRHAAKLAAW